MKTKLYLVGQMTGIKDYNSPAFNEAERLLVEAGYEVLNPAKINVDSEQWLACMAADLSALNDFQPDGIATLPNCDKSPGASIELLVAARMGWHVRPLEDWLCGK